MKIALVHELLTMRGGAERVLKILADLFPHAPIYTLLYDEEKLGEWFPRERVRTSSIKPVLGFDHHLYLKDFPQAVEAWDFSEFDVVLSTSSAFVHGIITNGAPKHLSYIHSPARYLWDRTHDVVHQASKGPLGWLKRWYVGRTFHPLRIWDSEAADRADMLLSASKTVQRRVELYWRRKSEVLYPPIDNFWLERPLSKNERKGYVVVSSLVRYKRIDLAIHACNDLRLPLTIVGEGPDRARLESLAGPTVMFTGYAPREKVAELLCRSKATIFPGDEDFGLVPLESMACGTPVLAYRSGGALETILEGKTGEFFSEATSESLAFTIKKFEQKKYSESDCKTHASKWSEATFTEGILAALKKLQNEK